MEAEEMASFLRRSIGVCLGAASVVAISIAVDRARAQQISEDWFGSGYFCPATGGTTGCYFCLGNPSPYPPPDGSGCDYGQGFNDEVISDCAKKPQETAGCHRILVSCGAYRNCATQKQVGGYIPLYYVCE